MEIYNKKSKNRIIGLLTDFGYNDTYVSQLKLQIYKNCDKIKIIDITHNIKQFDIQQAAFLLWQVYKQYPENSIFVVVVDPDVGSSRKSIIAIIDSYYIVTPDNGIITYLIQSAKNYQIYNIQNFSLFPNKISNTFHGRDIFALTAAMLRNGVSIEKFGVKTDTFIQLETKLILKEDELFLPKMIIYIDNFGNLITNVNADLIINKKMNINIYGMQIDKLYKNYNSGRNEKLIAYCGSCGLIEFGSYKRDSAKLYNATVCDTFTINFE